MPMLVIFVVLALILALVLAVIVLIPWLKANKSAKHNQLIALNVEVFQDRIKELQEDYGTGKMTESAFFAQKTELERQLLEASDTSQLGLDSADTHIAGQQQTADKITSSKKSRLIILVCVPVLTGITYVAAADRAPVHELWQGQDKLGQVADDLLTGKIGTPPAWAAKDSGALLNAIQTNVHHHAYDPQRWMRISDIYLAFDAKKQALEAMSRAYRLAPSDEAVSVRYAQTQFFSNDGMLNNSSRAALKNVLQRNPDHQGAQMLMIMGEARAGNYDNAQAWITKLRTGITSGGGDHSKALKSLDELSESILIQKQESLSAAGMSIPNTNAVSEPQSAPNQQPEATQVSDKSIIVSVKLEASLLTLVEASDTLFVTVQEATGGAPLAVKRLAVQQLVDAGEKGLMLTLSDNDAMIPTHTVSIAMGAEKPLFVTARVSKSGQAMSESGDLSSERKPLEYTNKTDTDVDIAVEINQKLP